MFTPRGTSHSADKQAFFIVHSFTDSLFTSSWATESVDVRKNIEVSVVGFLLPLADCWHRHDRWRYLDAAYFSVVTLTTVGLGDFVPSTRAGVRFHCFYCIVGLGLIALLLTAIYDLVRAMHTEAINVLITTHKTVQPPPHTDAKESSGTKKARAGGQPEGARRLEP